MRSITLVLLVACVAGELSKSVAEPIMLCEAAFLVLIGSLVHMHRDCAFLGLGCIILAAIGRPTALRHSTCHACASRRLRHLFRYGGTCSEINQVCFAGEGAVAVGECRAAAVNSYSTKPEFPAGGASPALIPLQQQLGRNVHASPHLSVSSHQKESVTQPAVLVPALRSTRMHTFSN
jgi:hypothetical protein